jgi:hydroxymethylbilane synthase
VDGGECDAIVLARAGLVRLGLEARATDVLSPEVSLPAVGQGALGIECREDDAETRRVLAPLHDEATALCVAAERAVMIALEGDCKTPLGAYGERVSSDDGAAHDLRLRAFVCDPDGSNLRRAEERIAWPDDARSAAELGARLGARLKSAVA